MDTVWIGFIGIVPVIGTVKEAVELVLALYDGDEEMIKKKENEIENNLKILVDEAKKGNYFPTKPRASKTRGHKNVSEVRKEKIIKHVNKRSNRPSNISADEQKEREEKVAIIREDMLEKMRKIDPKFYQELSEELRRSMQGEHVFNKGILKFHSKVLDEFKETNNITNLQMGELEGHTLQKPTQKPTQKHPQKHSQKRSQKHSQKHPQITFATAIQEKMVVHFNTDEFYVNANSVMYGRYSEVLHEAFLNVLSRINPEDVTILDKMWVNIIIYYMNKFEIYVDQMAKEKWIEDNGKSLFKDVKQEVAKMYKIDRGFDWSIRILHKVAPLFGIS